MHGGRLSSSDRVRTPKHSADEGTNRVTRQAHLGDPREQLRRANCGCRSDRLARWKAVLKCLYRRARRRRHGRQTRSPREQTSVFHGRQESHVGAIVRSQLGHGTAHRIGDKVEWLYPIWELWTWSGSPEQPRDRAHDVEVCAPVAGDEGRPGAVDLWLIHLIYEVIAAESTCVKCGASLGRRLRLVPPFVDSPLLDWRVLVVTRCEGWRRHRHVANVVEGSKSLLFGRLSPD